MLHLVNNPYVSQQVHIKEFIEMCIYYSVRARKSFVLRLLLCLIFWTILLWQFKANYLTAENLPVKVNKENQKEVEGPNSHMSASARVLNLVRNQTKPWLIIFWSTFFGKHFNIKQAWKKGECPVACEVTSNRSRASDANGFVVHARDSHMMPSIKSVPWILMTRENPVYTPQLTKATFMSKFNLLTSYRLDYDFPQPFYPMPQLTPPLPPGEKDGLIMAVFSNCEPVRTEYMRQLMDFVQVDSYGACLKNKDNLVGIYGSENGKDFKHVKTELARRYKFSLVFFNQDCDYFVDDQLIHALNAGSVPVVMGTDKLDEFLPGNLQRSVIKVRDFKSPKHLSDYLKFLDTNESKYNEYLEWKWKGLGNITGTTIGAHWKPKYPLYCQMCVALSEGKIHWHGLQPIACKPRSFEDWGIYPQTGFPKKNLTIGNLTTA